MRYMWNKIKYKIGIKRSVNKNKIKSNTGVKNKMGKYGKNRK